MPSETDRPSLVQTPDGLEWRGTFARSTLVRPGRRMWHLAFMQVADPNYTIRFGLVATRCGRSVDGEAFTGVLRVGARWRFCCRCFREVDHAA